MAVKFATAAQQALTSVQPSQERSTQRSRQTAHLVECLRLWEAMLPRRNGDEVAAALMVRGYEMMLGDLNPAQLNALTEMVLSECKWFPTVAECKEIMGRESYHNPFYISARHRQLDALGFPSHSPAKQITQGGE
jgi:hypothetical protein